MLVTDEILSYVAIAFCFPAMIIWLGPRPTRAVDLEKADH
jgi:hypothetical protein